MYPPLVSVIQRVSQTFLGGLHTGGGHQDARRDGPGGPQVPSALLPHKPDGPHPQPLQQRPGATSSLPTVPCLISVAS
eukprot:scaffold115779_cov16-Prasinocladus_malaysianus.AAC.1